MKIILDKMSNGYREIVKQENYSMKKNEISLAGVV